MADTTGTNTSKVKVTTFNKCMVKDLTDIFISEGFWNNAINAINASHRGDEYAIGNEPSNNHCTDSTYVIIGIVHMEKTRWVIFSTDDSDSEIGIFDESDCSYTVKVNDTCLGFKQSNLITGICKENYDCTFSVYWQDNLNSDRCLNLDNIPWKYTEQLIQGSTTCYEKVLDNPLALDCDLIKLHPLVTQPCVSIRRTEGSGQITNGSYIAVVAYSENGIRLTDYSMPSQPQGIWGHTGIGGALEVNIDNLDENFDEYELAIIAIVNQQAIAKKIGNYSIRQTKVHLDLINQSLPTVDISVIPLKSTIYDKSEKMFNINGYLIRTSVTSQPFFNYQPLANNIIAEWVAVKYPMDYYWKGGNHVGYMRDEVYPFFIRWIYNTGARSSSFHIPGRASIPSDLVALDAGDENKLTGETKIWQVYDTSEGPYPVAMSPLADGGIPKWYGSMQYWESAEKYPDNQLEIWGDLCGQPIRHHKMPSEERIHIHDNDNNIYVLGVKFNNIERPVDENGVIIPDIVGYEILRGSREGNRSIVAKGMFNNMWWYPLKDTPYTQGINGWKRGMYQNYPYNDLNNDLLQIWDYTTLDNNSTDVESLELLGANGKGGYYTNKFSFHSPDTTFYHPYLGDGMYIKLSKKEHASVVGRFEIPYKHPKFKFITDFRFGTAAFIGFGIGLLAAMGKVSMENSAEVGVTVPVAATVGNTMGIVPSSGIASYSILLANATENFALNPTSTSLLAFTAGTVNFLTYFPYYTGQGINQALEVMYQITRFRDYCLQYNSHGYYREHEPLSATPTSTYPYSFIRRRQIKDSGAKYISSGIQDYKDNHIINNLNRNKYILLDVDETFNINEPVSGEDFSRLRINEVGYTNDNFEKPYDLQNIQSVSKALYGAIKLVNHSQYGQLQSIVQLPTDSCVYEAIDHAYTGVIFGGDVYINRYTEKNPYMFFNSWMSNMPDGTEFKYTNHINGPIPKYWADYLKFDADDFDIKKPNNFDWLDTTTWHFFTTPSSFRRFNEKAGGSIDEMFTKKRAWFYLFYNGVRDFYCESELNIAYRDYGEEDTKKFYDPYGNSFNDLSKMFRSDLITEPIYNKYDLSLSTSKLFTNFASWGALLPKDYNPETYTTCFQYLPKRAIYSLQHIEGMKRDSWRSFLPLNYKDFDDKVNSIKSFNATGALILFEHSEPRNFIGIDQLQTDGGVKVSIGDGGLFANNMQSIVNADDTFEYGSCISSRSVINTPFGYFWASQQSGKIMCYSNSVNEVSKKGMKHWFAQNLPSQLLQAFPDYPLYDNPVKGIGVQSVYDNILELIYFTKKDYKPIASDIQMDNLGNFYYETEEVVSTICAVGYTYNAETQMCEQNVPTTDERCPDGCTKEDNDYGFLYNWFATTGTGTTSITSSDTWRVPTKTEYTTLSTYLSGDTVTGGKLKEVGTDHWIYPNTGATDIVNFIALGNGGRYGNNGVFYGLGLYCTLWTATAFDSSHAYTRYMMNTDAVFHEGWVDKHNGIAIRLVRDAVGAELALADGTEMALYTQNNGQQIRTVKIGVYVFTDNIEETEYRDKSAIDYKPLSSDWIEASKGAYCIAPMRCICAPVEQNITIHHPCGFDNPRCWKPASWTASYDPNANEGQGGWISFHDWIPDLMMPSAKHFYSIKSNGLWKHNELWNSYNKYYGSKDYGWEIDLPIMTPNEVETLRNIEYYLDVFKYNNEGMDFNHVIDENFNYATIYNSEQISGLLQLNLQGKNKPLDNIKYPIVNPTNIDIMFTKEEQKYRINQFWDITKDRGEFSGNIIPMWITEANGYRKIINPLYTNYQKSALQRKKFRHYGNNIILRRLQSNDKKFLLKLMNVKLLNSPR